MGRSGSGKTTLLHLLAALDRPDSGSIELNGNRVESLTDRQATIYRRTQLGIVFQQFNLVSTLTAKENVELPGLLAGKDEKWLGERAMSLLDELGVGDRHDHRPDALSGGEQQRVAIARAMMFSPPIILADEPTGALDSASADRLWTLLAELAREKEITVLMVTHEPAAAAHCARVFAMNDGRVVGSFGTEDADAGAVAARYQQLVG
jgi:putative ABC transport system ATP-binding protein